MPDSIADFLDEQPAATMKAEDILLPNGQTVASFMSGLDTAFEHKWGGRVDAINGVYDGLGPQQARNLLIQRMQRVALRLTDRVFYKNLTGQENGLAYVWDSKTIDAAHNPGAPSTCAGPLYGLDCSGFIAMLFNEAGVPFATQGAVNQQDPATIEGHIRAAIPGFSKVKVDDLKHLAIEKLQTGDILYWPAPMNHIGIVLTDAQGRKAVFAANGKPATGLTECDKNKSIKRGPTSFILTKRILTIQTMMASSTLLLHIKSVV